LSNSWLGVEWAAESAGLSLVTTGRPSSWTWRWATLAGAGVGELPGAGTAWGCTAMSPVSCVSLGGVKSGVPREEDLAQGNSSATMYEKMDPRIVDNEGRLVVMDEESIDASVLYPTSALAWVPDGEYHVALNAALNNWLHEWCQADPSRLYGATNIVAPHAVEAACDEVRRCKKEFGFPAVFLRTTLPNGEVRWWDESFDPFWATCEELGVAVGFHPFPGDTMYGTARYFDIIGPTSELVFMRTPFNIGVHYMEWTEAVTASAQTGEAVYLPL